jgi:uncharacterized membrane protein YebE (DUF533 family)
MHPRLSELLTHLDAEHGYLHDILRAVPVAQQHVRPAPDRWSIAEVVEHLAIVEGRVAGMVRTQVAAARAAGAADDPDVSPILPQMNLDAVVSRTRRVEASAAIRPIDVTTLDAAVDHLDAARAQLVAAIHTADGVNLAEISMMHPAFGPLSLYHWIGISGAHKRRHAAQIVEVQSHLDGA